MHFQTSLKASLMSAALFFLFSCTTIEVSNINDCRVGQSCVLTGELSIKRTASASVGILEIGDSCISIALPSYMLDDRKRWEHKKVSVKGVAYNHTAAPGVISYQLIDREVLVGACQSDKVIYLDAIYRGRAPS